MMFMPNSKLLNLVPTNISGYTVVDRDPLFSILGFYDYVRELNETLHEEEDHEREKFKREQLEC